MKIVLHVCCGVCAAGVIETLTSEGHQVAGLFYNPNIHPAAEYYRRLETTHHLAQEFGFPLEAVPYVPEEWTNEVTGLEDEPEGGRRCEVCFRLRLKRTFRYMNDGGWDAFTTTLTVSPHKSARIINRIGREIGGERFLERDFKKKDGFRRAITIAEKLALYRQNYCGCLYSMAKER